MKNPVLWIWTALVLLMTVVMLFLVRISPEVFEQRWLAYAKAVASD